MSLVSVNIICYNHAHFLKQRIDSVLGQSFTDFEVIIWDDCSTDNSRDIIEQYRNHEKVSAIIYNEKNSGSGFIQWKRAIDGCYSKYMWIAEGDDFAEEDFLKKTVSFLEQTPECVLVETNSFYIVQNKRTQTFSEYRNTLFPVAVWKNDFVKNGTEYILENLAYGCSMMNVSCILFRTGPLKHIELPLSSYKYCGDWALYIELCKTYQVGYIHEVLSGFQLHANNASKRGNKTGIAKKESFSIVENLLPFLRENGVEQCNYVKSVHRYVSIFGVPFQQKISLLYYYFTGNFHLAFTGLYYNFKNRFSKKK